MPGVRRQARFPMMARREPRRGDCRIQGLRLLCWIALLCCPAVPAFAQAGDAPAPVQVVTPQGEPQVGKTPRDPDFGVTTRHAGLQRHVEMYQWTRVGNGYLREWRGARVDSSGFAPGHDNPAVIPLREREWRAAITLDGKPLADAIVNTLGEWRKFRPGFSALPANMAVTFQPEGDGLGSADNPLAPQIGDLRVTWRAFVLPPLADRLVLRDGKWALRTPAIAPVAVDAGGDGNARERGEIRAWPRWPFVVVPIMVVLVLMLVVVRRRRSQT